MNNSNLINRVEIFVVDIVKLVDYFPKTTVAFRITGQLVDSACSVGANYTEAQAARSNKEFIAICGIVLKEVKETTYWLKIINKVGLIKQDKVLMLIDESIELSKIFAQIIINMNKKEKGVGK